MRSHHPLTPDERRSVEADAAVLETLGALAAECGPDAPGDDHAAYLAWRAAELRSGRVLGDERWDEVRVTRTARRARSEALALRSRIRLQNQRIVARPVSAPEAGTVFATALQAANVENRAPLYDSGVAAGAGRELWDEPCESWVDIPPDLPRGQFIALTVNGDSMDPLLHSGDVVLTQLGAAVRRDAVVVARRGDDGFVVKRIGDFDDRSIELVSLNPAYPPVRVAREANTVVGTVVLRWCAHDEV